MDIIRKALEQARQGRMHILGKMAETLEGHCDHPGTDRDAGTGQGLHGPRRTHHGLRGVHRSDARRGRPAPRVSTCVANVHELKEGEQIEVKVINTDPSGKVRLSRKVLLKEGEGTSPRYPGGGDAHGPSGGGDDRGGRGGDRDRGPRQ